MSRATVIREEEVTIAPSEADVRSNNMVRHPDGSIWINTNCTDPGLLKSDDQAASWYFVPIDLGLFTAPNGNSSEQRIGGFHIASDGCLWAIHQGRYVEADGRPAEDPHVWVSRSRDDGRSWTTAEIGYAGMAPDSAADPYTRADVAGAHPNFLERPDGTIALSCSMRYPDWEDYLQEDQSRPGIRDVMIRSRDGGNTWGDPTVVHQHATETAFAVNPRQSDHIVAATRIQRHALPGEDGEAIKSQISGVPYPPSLPRGLQERLVARIKRRRSQLR